jgi:hypothetical protein
VRVNNRLGVTDRRLQHRNLAFDLPDLVLECRNALCAPACRNGRSAGLVTKPAQLLLLVLQTRLQFNQMQPRLCPVGVVVRAFPLESLPPRVEVLADVFVVVLPPSFTLASVS